jgi:hypothetical protein
MEAGDGRAAPDLTLAVAEVCEADCDAGKLVFWVHLGNEGPVDGIATLEVDAQRQGVAETVLAWPLGVVEAGDFGQAHEIVIDSVDPARVERLIVRVLSADPQCDETDDEVIVWGPFCRD